MPRMPLNRLLKSWAITAGDESDAFEALRRTQGFFRSFQIGPCAAHLDLVHDQFRDALEARAFRVGELAALSSKAHTVPIARPSGVRSGAPT